MSNSWQTLADATTVAKWDAATRLLVTAAFLGGPEPDAAIAAARAFVVATGLTDDEMVSSLTAAVDARNRGNDFARYLLALTRTVKPAIAVAPPPTEAMAPLVVAPSTVLTDVREVALALTPDEKATIRSLLAAPPVAGRAVGLPLFSKSVAAGELTVHLHVVGGPNGAYLDVFVNHGRHLAATHPPVTELRDLYAVQVDGRPFGIRLP